MTDRKNNKFYDQQNNLYYILEGGEADKPAVLFMPECEDKNKYIVVKQLRNNDWVKGYYHDSLQSASMKYDNLAFNIINTGVFKDSDDNKMKNSRLCSFLDEVTRNNRWEYLINSDNTLKIFLITEYSDIFYGFDYNLEDYKESDDIVLSLMESMLMFDLGEEYSKYNVLKYLISNDEQTDLHYPIYSYSSEDDLGYDLLIHDLELIDRNVSSLKSFIDNYYENHYENELEDSEMVL